MQIIRYPDPAEWAKYLERPVFDYQTIYEKVRPILADVRDNGDRALIRLTEQFDKVRLNSIKVEEQEIRNARVNQHLEAAIRLAVKNIRTFHHAQKTESSVIETIPGVKCWRKQVAIERVGLYIPGGSAPLFSTLLMLAIPAQLAGCKQIVVCTPPDRAGNVDPAVLFCARLLGIDSVYKAGGAQAIAAMAYGSESVPAVDKIFGPGNQYVTAAKQLVSLEGLAIDMPAGPSEVAVVADQNADSAFIASDLLSQAEHGPDSQVILVTTDEQLIEKVQRDIEEQLKDLPRRDTAKVALSHSRIFLMDDMLSAMKLINRYAPEHLILNAADADALAGRVINAGSVFIGPNTPESAGDYASGTNHTLPTNGYARSYSGVSLDSFMKQITFQEISADGLKKIGPAIEVMAKTEQLLAHKNAVSLRLARLSKENPDV